MGGGGERPGVKQQWKRGARMSHCLSNWDANMCLNEEGSACEFVHAYVWGCAVHTGVHAQRQRSALSNPLVSPHFFFLTATSWYFLPENILGSEVPGMGSPLGECPNCLWYSKEDPPGGPSSDCLH